MARSAAAVFFDVDFTLIYPGPTFQGSGYRDFCKTHGVEVDPEKFDAAVAAASSFLAPTSDVYDPAIFIHYTRRIIEGMGGAGPGTERAARDIYDEWSACHHFELYDDVSDVLRSLHADGVKIGLISNTAAIADRVPEPLRARGNLRRRHFLLRPRLHEAAPEHLRERAAAGSGAPARGGDGGRQPRPRHRRRAQPRHARRSRVALGAGPGLSRGCSGDSIAARAAEVAVVVRGGALTGAPAGTAPGRHRGRSPRRDSRGRSSA